MVSAVQLNHGSQISFSAVVLCILAWIAITRANPQVGLPTSFSNLRNPCLAP